MSGMCCFPSRCEHFLKTCSYSIGVENLKKKSPLQTLCKACIWIALYSDNNYVVVQLSWRQNFVDISRLKSFDVWQTMFLTIIANGNKVIKFLLYFPFHIAWYISWYKYCNGWNKFKGNLCSMFINFKRLCFTT